MIDEDVWKGCKHIRIKPNNTAAISFMSNTKHSNIHRPLESLIYQGYPLNEKLCIVNAIQCYLGI